MRCLACGATVFLIFLTFVIDLLAPALSSNVCTKNSMILHFFTTSLVNLYFTILYFSVLDSSGKEHFVIKPSNFLFFQRLDALA